MSNIYSHLRARMAYIDRSDKNCPKVTRYLEPSELPECCRIGHKLSDDPYIILPDHMSLGEEGEFPELIFLSDLSGLFFAYAYQGGEKKKENLFRQFGSADSSEYVYIQRDPEALQWRIGALELCVRETGVHNFSVLKIEQVSLDEDLFLRLIADLDDMRIRLNTTPEVWVDRGKDIRAAVPSDGEDKERSRYRKLITNHEEASQHLDHIETIFKDIERHAETDLKQVYEKLPIRKIKHINSRTILEYAATRAPKVNAVITREHYDLYEHRMIRQYLGILEGIFCRHLERCRERLDEIEAGIERYDYDRYIVDMEMSYRNAGLTLTEEKKNEIREKFAAKKKDLTKQKKNTVSEKAVWESLIDRVHHMPERFRFLQVMVRGERLHSTMLFMRNRYYRAIYEYLKAPELIGIYTDIAAIPSEKLYTLYERWCFFKLVDIFATIYKYSICECEIRRNSADGETKSKVTDLGADFGKWIEAMISDTREAFPEWIHLTLKRTDQLKYYGGRGENRTSKTEIFYQFAVGEQEIRGKAYPRIIPDFLVRIDGNDYFLDAKCKHYFSYTKDADARTVRKDKYENDRENVLERYYRIAQEESGISSDLGRSFNIKGLYLLQPFWKDRKYCHLFEDRQEIKLSGEDGESEELRSCYDLREVAKKQGDAQYDQAEVERFYMKHLHEIRGFYGIFAFSPSGHSDPDADAVNTEGDAQENGVKQYDGTVNLRRLIRKMLEYDRGGESYSLDYDKICYKADILQYDPGRKAYSAKHVARRVGEGATIRNSESAEDLAESRSDLINLDAYQVKNFFQQASGRPGKALQGEELKKYRIRLRSVYKEHIGTRICPMCGEDIKKDWITAGSTVNGYPKYHIHCQNCDEFWVITHCDKKGCNMNIIKHRSGGNYLSEKGSWDVSCPFCEGSSSGIPELYVNTKYAELWKLRGEKNEDKPPF